MRNIYGKIVAVALILLATTGLMGLDGAKTPPLNEMEEIETIRVQGNSFSITVDPRIELLAVVQHFTSWAPGGHIKSETTYKKEIYDSFSAYKDHRAVACVEDLFRAGFTHDAPVRLMLYHQDPPGLSQHTPYSYYLINRAGGEDILADLLDALRDFARKTNFMDFYEAHRPLYHIHTEEVASILADKKYVRALEDFFGESRGGYHVILPPLFAGGYGPAIETEEGPELFAIIGPCALKGDRVTFACRSYLESIILHEWSHSFVNPLVDRYYDLFVESLALFDPIRGMMRNQAYPTWRITLYEHIVRAAEINIRGTLYGDFDEEASLQVQEGKGFWYVGRIDSLLDVYQDRRERYPTFSQFMPVIADGLSKLSVDALPERVTDFAGPLSGIFPRTSCIYLVYPTAMDRNKVDSLKEDMQGFMDFLSSFQMESRLVSDQAALEMNWADKVAFIYGNTINNSYLRNLGAAIPLKFYSGAMEFGGRRYEGEGILLISCMPNPFNKMLPFVVCAANRPEDLINTGSRINSPNEWDADYVLYRGEEKLDAGRYCKESGEWTLVDSESED